MFFLSVFIHFFKFIFLPMKPNHFLIKYRGAINIFIFQNHFKTFLISKVGIILFRNINKNIIFIAVENGIYYRYIFNYFKFII